MSGDVGSKSGRARSTADWERIEADFRAGVKSLRGIAAEHGVTHAAIRKRAAKDDWIRDLGARIRAAADAELARGEVSTDAVSTQVSAATERDIVRANAQIQVAIVREHRADIRRARSLSQRLLADLESAAGSRETLEDIVVEITREDKSAKRREFLMRAVGLTEHAGTLESLTRSLRHLVGMERQAFGIDEQPPPPESPGAGCPVRPQIDYVALRERLRGRPEAPGD